MGAWKEYKLGEIVEFNRNTINRNYPYEEIDYLDTGSVTAGKVSGYQCLKTVDAPSRAKRLVQSNDIIYSTVRPIQRHYAILKNPSPRTVVSTGFVVLTAKADLDPFFLYFFLTQDEIVGYLDSIAEGSTSAYPSLTPDVIADLDIHLPPRPEQRAIASVLSSLDDKIDLLHRQNKTLEGLAQTLFRQWFVEEAKQEWTDSTFSAHTLVNRGLSYKGSGLTDGSGGIPMHNLNSVYEGGGYKYEGIKYYNGDFKERHVVKPGDIIVANTEQGHEFRLIGFPAIVPDYFGGTGLFSQHIYRLEILTHAYLTREFIYYLIMTPRVREQIIGATNGSTVNMLAMDGLQNTEFKLPPEDKVLRFSQIIGNYWEKKNRNQYQIRTLTQLRDTLLPKLMSGEVRVRA